MSNRFAAIAFSEEDGSSFVDLASPSPVVVAAASSKKAQKQFFKELQGSSSLEKVSHALRLKKQAEEEERLRQAAAAAATQAAAEKKAQEAIAAANAAVPLENTHRRTGKPSGHSRHEERERAPMTPRQREHAHGREARNNRRKGDGEKKRGAGKGNWGKLVEDQEVTTLNPFPEAPKKQQPVEEAPVVPVEAPKPAEEAHAAAPAVVEAPAEPHKPAVLTYEEYLAEKAKSSLVLNLPRRKANEGNADNVQWKKAVPLVKKDEDVYNLPGRKAEGQLSHKPRPLQTSVPSITVDPRLNIDFSKPSYPRKPAGAASSRPSNGRPGPKKAASERADKEAAKPART